MKRIAIALVMGVVMGIASIARAAEIDCAKFEKAFVTYENTLMRANAGHLIVAMATAEVLLPQINETLRLLRDPPALASINVDGTGTTAQLAEDVLEGRAAIFQSVTCSENTKAMLAFPPTFTTPRPMACEIDGQKRPRIGMTLSRARECYGEWTLFGEMAAPGGGAVQSYGGTTFPAIITVRDGKIVNLFLNP